MPRRPKTSAYDLTDAQLKAGRFADVVDSHDTLAQWLVQELEAALSARGAIAERIRYYWTYYEQGRTRGSRGPWPDAADLTSPYGTEFVDAVLGRVMDTIMVEPLWIVEGWGDSTSRAPFIEEFHQRTQEQERLQSVLRGVLLRALVEPAGILELSEATETRRVRKRIRATLELDPMTGTAIIDEDAAPVLAKDEQGGYIEATDPNTPSAEVDIDVWEPVRLGPAYDIIPYLDYLRFPFHARSRSEIWGYGKRFYRRLPELKARAAAGAYDPQAVERLGDDNEYTTTSQDAPRGVTVPDQRGPTAQKELWEMPILADLDGEGERWWLATVHPQSTTLLRLKVDDRTARFLEFVPFPKPGSRDGYSLIEKMMTALEEDTAVRNMRADKCALSISAPILRVQGALWNPYEQPFAPGSVVDVRDTNELKQFELSDVPASVNVWKQDVRPDVERLIGLNDVSVGTQTQERRTLGEVQLAAGYSEVRVKAIIAAIQESLEELGSARHEIWKRTLAAQQQGMPIPSTLMAGLDARGIDTGSIADGRITAQMLEGQFWFKARGSVDTANLDRQATNLSQLLATLGPLMQLNPMIRAIFSTPQAAKAFVEQILRVYRWPDKQAFLGSEAQAAMQQQQQQDQMLQMVQGMIGGARAGAEAPGAPAPMAEPPIEQPPMGGDMMGAA